MQYIVYCVELSVALIYSQLVCIIECSMFPWHHLRCRCLVLEVTTAQICTSSGLEHGGFIGLHSRAMRWKVMSVKDTFQNLLSIF